MIRIGASDLEGLRYYKDSDDMTMDQLVARLRHEEPPTTPMLAGRALAKILEHAPDGDMEHVECDGFMFDFSELDVAMDLPPFREVKAERVYETAVGPVTLVCKCDALTGITVRDAKLTGRFDAEKYLDSLQWRAYLDAFGCQRFIYDIFTADVNEDRHTVRVKGYDALPMYGYPGMADDVRRAVEELAGILVEHGTQR